MAATTSSLISATSLHLSSKPHIPQPHLNLHTIIPQFTSKLHPLHLSRLQTLTPLCALEIEKETPENEAPPTILCDFNDGFSASVKGRFEKMIRKVQDSVCVAIEATDGSGKFKEDAWTRPGGGGGISRVLQDGVVFKKADANVSVIYGVMSPKVYRAAKGDVD